MKKNLFTNPYPSVSSDRILYTPSNFARSSLFYLQETGTLQALQPHTSVRERLDSCLFFLVLSGSGTLIYEGKTYVLKAGDCVFIHCKSSYEHKTDDLLWSLSWCHFYGANMPGIYRKYEERGGTPVFHPMDRRRYEQILKELYFIAGSFDYVRDMKLHEKLSSLLIYLMEDAWKPEDKKTENHSQIVDIRKIKEYLDENFKEKITLDQLAEQFFVDKFYLSRIFKESYGITIGAYLIQNRITYAKQQLRFTDKTIEMIAAEMGMEPGYLTRIFKNAEGINPSAYRKQWNGKHFG